jgi:hypothetical protein
MTIKAGSAAVITKLQAAALDEQAALLTHAD